jgi:hypothetical protein
MRQRVAQQPSDLVPVLATYAPNHRPQTSGHNRVHDTATIREQHGQCRFSWLINRRRLLKQARHRPRTIQPNPVARERGPQSL